MADPLTKTLQHRGRPLREHVLGEMRKMILDQVLSPGEPIREERLASMHGVSRGPIREAIADLEREGLVQRRAGRSSFVVELTPRDLEEVLSLRRAQEAVAVRFAVRAASDLELLELRHRAGAHADACAAAEPNEIRSQLDIDFHDFLYRIARHARLYQSWLMIRMQVFMFLRMRDTSRLTSEAIMRPAEGHRELVDALAARDLMTALAVADNHLLHGYAASISSMPEWWLEDADATLLPPPPPVGTPPAVRTQGRRGADSFSG
jgi:DNA-binding GntR family transcriptional regulator